jgi:hypothetical protein
MEDKDSRRIANLLEALGRRAPSLFLSYEKDLISLAEALPLPKTLPFPDRFKTCMP